MLNLSITFEVVKEAYRHNEFREWPRVDNKGLSVVHGSGGVSLLRCVESLVFLMVIALVMLGPFTIMFSIVLLKFDLMAILNTSQVIKLGSHSSFLFLEVFHDTLEILHYGIVCISGVVSLTMMWLFLFTLLLTKALIWLHMSTMVGQVRFIGPHGGHQIFLLEERDEAGHKLGAASVGTCKDTPMLKSEIILYGF